MSLSQPAPSPCPHSLNFGCFCSPWTMRRMRQDTDQALGSCGLGLVTPPAALLGISGYGPEKAAGEVTLQGSERTTGPYVLLTLLFLSGWNPGPYLLEQGIGPTEFAPGILEGPRPALWGVGGHLRCTICSTTPSALGKVLDLCKPQFSTCKADTHLCKGGCGDRGETRSPDPCRHLPHLCHM